MKKFILFVLFCSLNYNIEARLAKPHPPYPVPILTLDEGEFTLQKFISLRNTESLIENILVNDDVNSSKPQHEPCIAVFGSNVYVGFKDWRTGNKWDYFARSTDFGKTWQANIQMPSGGYPNTSDPVVMVDGSGNLYYEILAYDNFISSDVFIAKSTDGGISFLPLVRVSNNSSDAFQDKEWMAVDGNFVYASWTAFGANVDIRFSRSTDGGANFLPWITINDVSYGGRQGSIPLAGRGDTVYVIWGWDGRRSGSYACYCARSTDRGKTFEPDVLVSKQFLNDDMPWRTALIPSAAFDRKTGNIYTTWYDSRLKSGKTDVFIVVSQDGGKTWTFPFPVNENAGDTTHQFMPAISVDDKGWVHIGWYDTRSGMGRVDYYYTYSTDGGKSFVRPDKRVSSVASTPVMDSYSGPVIGDYNGLVAYGNNVYAVWGDSRNGNQDIYYAGWNPQTGIEAWKIDRVYVRRDIVKMKNIPNPFSRHTEIQYLLPERGEVSCKIYDVTGRVIKSFVDSKESAGSYSLKWDGRDDSGVSVPSGIYFYRLNLKTDKYGDFVDIKKIVVNR